MIRRPDLFDQVFRGEMPLASALRFVKRESARKAEPKICVRIDCLRTGRTLSKTIKGDFDRLDIEIIESLITHQLSTEAAPA